jgi:hypothetical protein
MAACGICSPDMESEVGAECGETQEGAYLAPGPATYLKETVSAEGTAH